MTGKRQRHEDVPQQPVVVGRIAGVYGVRGWVRVRSFTEPRDNILQYSPWQFGSDASSAVRVVEDARPHGRGLIAKLEGIDDRDAAAALVGADICVSRDRFADVSDNEYYWVDLEGMRVESCDGRALGAVANMLATGANDVMIVEGERRRLIPFLLDAVVREVDRDGGKIVVDWDPEF